MIVFDQLILKNPKVMLYHCFLKEVNSSWHLIKLTGQKLGGCVEKFMLVFLSEKA